jgi:XTP/dITP diphosphohydrolase
MPPKRLRWLAEHNVAEHNVAEHDVAVDVLLATRNEGKLLELRPLFASRGLHVIDLAAAHVVEAADEDALEAFETFEENALAKARYFRRLTGRPTVADDSGIAVVALGGRPGVRSKRWSGRADLSGQALDDENNRMLLHALHDADGPGGRRANYVCAAAYVDASRELVRRGEVHGHILTTARGAGGFGYDPYFFSDELGMTFGEASREAKEIVSHRGRAFRSLLDALTDLEQ